MKSSSTHHQKGVVNLTVSEIQFLSYNRIYTLYAYFAETIGIDNIDYVT